MKISAGLAIIVKNNILLVHPTNANWSGTYSIPKGLVEDGEDLIDAAIRETYEEIGVSIEKRIVQPDPIVIEYKSKNGKVYKKVYAFIVILGDTFDVPKEDLQLEEVDWAGFLNKDEAKDKIFWRFKELLNELE